MTTHRYTATGRHVAVLALLLVAVMTNVTETQRPPLRGSVSRDELPEPDKCIDAFICYSWALSNSRRALGGQGFGPGTPDWEAEERCMGNPVWRGFDPAPCRTSLLQARQRIEDMYEIRRSNGPTLTRESKARYDKLHGEAAELLAQSFQCSAAMETRYIYMRGSFQDPTWMRKCRNEPAPSDEPGPRSPTITGRTGDSRRRACSGGPILDEWDAWKERVADAISQQYRPPRGKRDYGHFEFTVDEAGSPHDLVVHAGDGTPATNKRIGDAFQTALASVDPSVLALPTRGEIASLDVYHDSNGCLMVRAYKRYPNPGGRPSEAPRTTRGDVGGTSCLSAAQMRLLDAASALDRLVTDVQDHSLAATDQFFAGMAEGVEANLVFLAQPPGEPVDQIATQTQQGFKAIVDYVNNTDSRKHERLLAVAQRAVEEFQHNRARTLGTLAGNLVFEPLYGGAGAVNSACGTALACSARLCRRGSCTVLEACGAKAVKWSPDASEIAGAEEAAKRLRQMQATAAVPGDTEVIGAIKEDCFWRSMRNATGDAAFDLKFNQKRPGSWDEVYWYLKTHFGGKVKGVESPIVHQQGLPVERSIDEILSDIGKAGHGAEGIVFVGWKSGESHAFNVANLKGRVVLIDDQKQFWGAKAAKSTVDQMLKGEVAWSRIYRTR